MTPGGAPVPPECGLAKPARRRCIPLHPNDASRERPSLSGMAIGILSHRNIVKGRIAALNIMRL